MRKFRVERNSVTRFVVSGFSHSTINRTHWNDHDRHPKSAHAHATVGIRSGLRELVGPWWSRFTKVQSARCRDGFATRSLRLTRSRQRIQGHVASPLLRRSAGGACLFLPAQHSRTPPPHPAVAPAVAPAVLPQLLSQLLPQLLPQLLLQSLNISRLIISLSLKSAPTLESTLARPSTTPEQLERDSLLGSRPLIGGANSLGTYGPLPRAAGTRSSIPTSLEFKRDRAMCVRSRDFVPSHIRARRRRTIIPWAESRDREGTRRRDVGETPTGPGKRVPLTNMRVLICRSR